VHANLSIDLLSTIQLPSLGAELGPIHTIVQDDHNNIYYSDEINHSLVSLNEAGEVRWHRNQKGKKAGEFHYPKGIEWGWINQNGIKTECLAVCDSWNKRIQFFDQYGNFIAVWGIAGDISFSDVVDIRFIGDYSDSTMEHSCWLILDRGHHSLIGLDPSGLLIVKIGRALPDNLEPHWDAPCDISNPPTLHADLIRDYLPYDSLFMPLRIFGNARNALFVWEPKSRRLKQAVSRAFLPVLIKPPSGGDWIGADEKGLLCFDKSAGVLEAYNSQEKTWQSAAIEGTPLPLGRSTTDLWLQDGMHVHHYSIS
jgi:hypothetical protein